MPPGKMEWFLENNRSYSCQGYETYGTWIISYHFPSGKKPDGVHYNGTGRTAYIPDSPDGRRVLALLIKAFERRHTFIVGTSVTTGAQNVVVWSGIHHKTNTHGGSSHFGYPDATYLNRVTLEMADRGVTLDPTDNIDLIIGKNQGSRQVKGW
jgi:deltex